MPLSKFESMWVFSLDIEQELFTASFHTLKDNRYQTCVKLRYKMFVGIESSYKFEYLTLEFQCMASKVS